MVSAESTVPVVGVPIDASSLQGLDELLATVQMPSGIPVATMAIGKADARNAGLYVDQMLSLTDEALVEKLIEFKCTLAKGIEAKAEKLTERLRADGF